MAARAAMPAPLAMTASNASSFDREFVRFLRRCFTACGCCRAWGATSTGLGPVELARVSTAADTHGGGYRTYVYSPGKDTAHTIDTADDDSNNRDGDYSHDTNTT